MTARGDNGNEMSPAWLLDDETIEAIVAGDEVDARFDSLVAFARHLERQGDGPPPPASPELEAVLAGLPADPVSDPTVVDLACRRRWRTRTGALTATAAKLAGLGVVAKVGLGTSMAFAGVVGAGAAGVLPAQATEGVRSAIEVVTPVDFGDDETPDTITTGEDPARPGDREPHGPGESDGPSGADGGDVSGDAPGSGRPPVLRGEGSDGQDRPRDTRPSPPTTGRHGPPPSTPSEGNGPPNGTPGGNADDRADERGEADDDEGDQDDGDGGDDDAGNAGGQGQAPGQQRRPTTTTAPTTAIAPSGTDEG